MKKLSQFCREHPVMIACIATAIMSVAITELFFVDLINKTHGEKADAFTIAFRIIVLIAIPLLWWAVVKATKPIALILIAALIIGVPRTQAAPLVIGGLLIVVIGGGAIVGCKIVKRCNKIAKKREHQLTNEQFFVAGESDNYAALLTWPEGGYCAAERLLPVEPTVFTMQPTFPKFPGDSFTIPVRADRGYEFTQTWSEFDQEVSGYDLFLSHPVSYSKNGHRIEPEQSIISFSTNRIAKIGRGGLLVTIERSSDLKTWETILKLNIEPWMTPRIEDCLDEEQQTYRITASEP